MQGAVGARWPFAKADLQTPAYAATRAVTIADTKTYLNPAILTGNMTINLTIDSEVQVGAELICQIKTTGTEVTTFGTGFTAPTVTGVAGKNKVCQFVYDGTTFKPVAVAFQID